jgi:oxygen-independent coproporphyrinogen-3 oxidase
VPFCNTICYYCACNKINTGNQKHAQDYIGRLIQEMALQSGHLQGEHPVEQLHFGGGTPTFLSDEQFQRVFEGLNRHFQLLDGANRDYSVEIDPRKLAPQRIDVLAEFGFNRMSIGVQDFDSAVQEAVNRIQSEAETQAIVDAARSNGFESINVDLIYGLPLQTVSGFQRTLERVMGLSPDRISLYNYAHLPDRFKTQRQIRAEDLPEPETKLELMSTAIRQFEASGYEYVGMDHFAKPTDGLLRAREDGDLHRNFQGYTTHGHCELVALGVSAISKVGRAYAQNAKTLEGYYAAIDEGRLATDRGYVMNGDDEIIGDVIQDLMCKFEVDAPAFGARHKIDFWQYFESAWPQLAQMAEEGLLDLSREKMVVTPQGRFLIRNVCMAFDAHLPPQVRGFSKTI